MNTNHLARAVKIGILLMCGTSLSSIGDTDLSAIEKITVTGQKIDRSIQETPTSVAVVTTVQMEQQNINSFTDVIERAPNISASDNSFNIRGIDAFNVSGGGNSYLASVYIDGAALPYRMIQQGAFSTWDINQVEIFRGPQSTLQGRNALAGAIIMNTQKPTYDWQGKFKLGFGEYGNKEAAIAFGGGIFDDQMAIRVSAESKEQDGFIDNLTRDEKSDYSSDDTVRVSLLLEPKSIPELSATLALTYNDMEDGVNWSDSPEINPDRIDTTSFDAPTFDFTENKLANLRVNYDLSDEWTLTSISTYSDSQYGYEWDGDGTSTAESILLDNRTDKTKSQEIRAVFSYENLTGVIGAYYSSLEVEDISGGQQRLSFTRLGVKRLLISPADYGGLGLPEAYADQILTLYSEIDPVKIGTDTETFQSVTNKALFFDGTYQVNDKLDIIAGARWDKETQENANDRQVVIEDQHLLPASTTAGLDLTTATVIGGLNARLLAMASDASGVEPLVDASFNAFLPKLGVSYHWNDDITTSFIAQKGYRSGGVGTNIAQATTHTYDAEYTKNYELSFRSVWLDGQLSLNANAFYIDWEDQQVRVQLSSNQYDRETRNAGNSTVKGFETEVVYKVNAAVSLYAGLGKSTTTFEEFMIEIPGESPTDLSGFSFVNSPEWTGNIGLTYDPNSGFMANINANYVSESRTVANPYLNGKKEGDAFFDPQNDKRTLINIKVGYEWDNIGLYLTGNNLLDEEYFVSADSGYGTHTLGDPRTISMKLTGAF